MPSKTTSKPRRERFPFTLHPSDLDKVAVYGEPAGDPRPAPPEGKKYRDAPGNWWRLYPGAKGGGLEFYLRRFEREEITTTRTTNTVSFRKGTVTYWAIYAPPYTESVPCYTSRTEALRHVYKFLEKAE